MQLHFEGDNTHTHSLLSVLTNLTKEDQKYKNARNLGDITQRRWIFSELELKNSKKKIIKVLRALINVSNKCIKVVNDGTNH